MRGPSNKYSKREMGHCLQGQSQIVPNGQICMMSEIGHLLADVRKRKNETFNGGRMEYYVKHGVKICGITTIVIDVVYCMKSLLDPSACHWVAGVGSVTC